MVAPPVVKMQTELVQSVGSLLFRAGYSFRSTLEVTPFICLTILYIPKVGSQSISRWTWSGMTSISKISAFSSVAMWKSKCFSLSSMPLTRTLRRYFGHQTTWYWQEKTIFRLDLYFLLMHTLYSTRLYIANSRECEIWLLRKWEGEIHPHRWIQGHSFPLSNSPRPR